MIGVERLIYSASGSAELPVISQKIRSFCSFYIDQQPLRLLAESGNERLSPLLAFPASCNQVWKAVWWERIRSPATCLRRPFIQDLLHFSLWRTACVLACTRTHCTSQDTTCPPFCEVDLPFMRADYVHWRTVAVFDVSQDWESLKCWMLSELVVSQKASYQPWGLISTVPVSGMAHGFLI